VKFLYCVSKLVLSSLIQFRLIWTSGHVLRRASLELSNII